MGKCLTLLSSVWIKNRQMVFGKYYYKKPL